MITSYTPAFRLPTKAGGWGASTEAMLSITSLSIGYGRKTVLSGLTRQFHGGQAICLAGRNGRGKSTLLRTLAGLQKPLDGSISVDGRPLESLSKKELSRIIGIVLTPSATQQGQTEAGGLTVSELVSMGRMPYTGFFGTLTDDDRSIVAEAIETIGITPLTNRKIDSLSDGERQKAMIARTLAQQVPVIILDEPTAFLDYESRIELYTLLQHLAHKEQKLILFSSHDLDMATKYSDEVWTI